MLALGVVIVSRVEGYSVDLTSFLFGDVLGVSSAEVVVSAIAAAAVRRWSRCCTGRSC